MEDGLASWKAPDQALEDREFWEVLDGCLNRLPRSLSSAFILRELEEMDTAEMRRILDLSEVNLRVRLHPPAAAPRMPGKTLVHRDARRSKENIVSWLKSLVRVLTLRCEAASELSSRELDDSLPRLDRAAIFCHILACRSCRRFRVQVRLIRKAVRYRRGQLLAGTDSAEDGLSAKARHRIALACQDVGRDDAGAETTPE